MYYYFQSEKDRLARKRTREASKGVGKPRIGGPFELVDQDGQKFSSEDLKGKFSLVSTTMVRIASEAQELTTPSSSTSDSHTVPTFARTS